MSKKVEVDGSMIIVKPSDSYKKSNDLISSKYKSTLIENKILAISLAQITKLKEEEVEINGEITKVFTSEMKSSDLMKKLQVSRKNLPAQLKSAYLKMSSRQIGIEDESGEFRYRALFIGSDYKNGSFKLYYNPLLGSYYKELSKNYTLLSLDTMMKFKSVHSFRLYEMLKKDCYGDNELWIPEIKGSKYIIEYSLSELKLTLGVVNAEAESVRTVLNRKGAPDYDRAVEVSKEKGFERWIDFKRRCIDPAIKEINEKTELNVTYELEKSGQGGKVHGLTFIVVIYNEEEKAEKTAAARQEISLTDDEKMDFLSDLQELYGDYAIKLKELRRIAEAASWDIEKCKKAGEVLKRYSKTVESVVQFLLKAIQEDWEPAISKEAKGKTPEYKGFEQRKYDFAQLEKELLA